MSTKYSEEEIKNNIHYHCGRVMGMMVGAKRQALKEDEADYCEVVACVASQVISQLTMSAIAVGKKLKELESEKL